MQQQKAIVFIHGFLGSNEQFYGIKKLLPGCGADFVDHVVAGHGGTLDEFVGSDDKSWQDGLNEHLERLRGEYDGLYLVGHSMGGLLAVRAAVASPEKLGGIVAIAFPIKLRISVSWVGNHYNATKPKKDGEDPRVTAARKLGGVKIRSFTDFFKVVPNVLCLLRLAKRARRELLLLKVPLAVINSERDGIVSEKVPKLVKEDIPAAQTAMLKNSYHFLFDGDDEKQMAEAIREMVSA